jgi:hypothetical protein
MFNTRKEITEHFNVEDGIITNPGQYEGERCYVPYLWESDDGEEVEDREFLYIITDSDRHQFPELDGVETVRLYLSENGFVCEMQFGHG